MSGLWDDEEMKKMDEIDRKYREWFKENKDKKIVRNITLTLTLEELWDMRGFATLPKWIQKEFSDKYNEANCADIPCGMIRRIVESFEGSDWIRAMEQHRTEISTASCIRFTNACESIDKKLVGDAGPENLPRGGFF